VIAGNPGHDSSRRSLLAACDEGDKCLYGGFNFFEISDMDVTKEIFSSFL
jgi:hypothetical protein